MGDFELEAVLQWGPGATWDHSDLLMGLPGARCPSLHPMENTGHLYRSSPWLSEANGPNCQALKLASQGPRPA